MIVIVFNAQKCPPTLSYKSFAHSFQRLHIHCYIPAPQQSNLNQQFTSCYGTENLAEHCHAMFKSTNMYRNIGRKVAYEGADSAPSWRAQHTVAL